MWVIVMLENKFKFIGLERIKAIFVDPIFLLSFPGNHNNILNKVKQLCRICYKRSINIFRTKLHVANKKMICKRLSKLTFSALIELRLRGLYSNETSVLESLSNLASEIIKCTVGDPFLIMASVKWSSRVISIKSLFAATN
jgi:hypothetical protein